MDAAEDVPFSSFLSSLLSSAWNVYVVASSGVAIL